MERIAAGKMGWNMARISKKLAARLAALSVATVGLSGCVYDMGLGYASDGYYECDPYAPFDSYYDCDSSYGFYNIGFGGGWYDSFWYPGYGYYVFDNYGRRFNMHDHHRRYWGDRRHRWYREHHGRNRGHDGDRRRGRGHGYGYNNSDEGAVDQPIAWPERGGGRRGERAGREPRPTPPPAIGGNEEWRDRDGRRERRRDGEGRRGEWRGGNAASAPIDAAPAPQPTARPSRDRGGDNPGRGGGRWQQPSGGGQQSGAYQPPATPRSAPPPPAPRSAPPAPRVPPAPREVPDRLPD
jgi:hypothetical protein